MRIIIRFILQIIANAVAIAIAAWLVPQISFGGDLLDYLIIGVILAIANLTVKPILKIISAPLIFITLGLFLIVINAVILFGVNWFVKELTIAGFWGYFWGVIIISIINAIIVGPSKKRKRQYG